MVPIMQAAQARPPELVDLDIRAARSEDAVAVADILAEAFPALYRATFGPLRQEEVAWLLTELYRAGHLSLAQTRVAERGGRIVGVLILHIGESIGRGSPWAYWRLLRSQIGLWRAWRAFCGGLLTNAVLDRRIPHAPDLAYIEALAVAAAERGQGIGTCLLYDALSWAEAQGRSRLALHVLHTNTGARRLYERMGFAPWEPVPLRWPRLSTFTRRPPSWTALLMARSVHG